MSGKIEQIVKYYFKKNSILPVVAFISLVFVYFVLTGNGSFIPSLYENFWDPFFAVFGILLTLGVTFSLIRKEWMDSLPRRLNVHFISSKGLYLASCYNINIMAEADSRALGLQVGQQMLKTQQLKFNPSIEVICQDQPICIKSNNSGERWVKYSTIAYHLNHDDINDNAQEYIVWSIFNNKITKKTTLSTKIPFDQNVAINDITILLNDDLESQKKFTEIDESSQITKLYLTNSAIIDGAGEYNFVKLNINEVKNLLSKKQFISAIGHESTAEYLTEKIGIPITCERIEVNLNCGDQCLVFRLKRRIEEGKVLKTNDLEKAEIEFGLLTKTKSD